MHGMVQVKTASRVHMVEIQGKGMVLMGSRVEKDLGGGLERRAFYPPGPRSCPQTPAGLSVPVGNASGWGIDRLKVCAGSFPVSWMGY